MKKDNKRYFIGETPADLRTGIEPFPEGLKKELSSKHLDKSGLRLGANQNWSQTFDGNESTSASDSRSSSILRKSLSLKRIPAERIDLIPPTDPEKAIKEGVLLFQVGEKNWVRRVFVLNAKFLYIFSKGSKTPLESLKTEDFRGVVLRASSDSAIELVTINGSYTMVADTARESEEWVLSLIKVSPSDLRKNLILTSVIVTIPSLDCKLTSRVDVTTTVGQVHKTLSEKNPLASEYSLCLRRGEFIRFFQDDELIQIPPLIYKSHFLEMRKTDEEQVQSNSGKLFDIEGYLMKQGAEGPIKAWKKRLFSTRTNNLFYFKTHATNDDNLQDAIGLINIADSLAIDPCYNNAEFEIKTSKRIYKLQAATKEDMLLWVHSLRKIREHFRNLAQEVIEKQVSLEFIPNEEGTTPTKEGYLSKRGYFNSAFQQRYFILANGHLFYYSSSDTGQHARGKISIVDSHVLSVLNDNPEEEHSFLIITGARKYHLKAESRKVMEEWLRAIAKEKERF